VVWWSIANTGRRTPGKNRVTILRDGAFFSREDTALEAEPTEANRIALLEEQLTQAQLAMAELAGLITGGGQ
jgi:hypothetical protein